MRSLLLVPADDDAAVEAAATAGADTIVLDLAGTPDPKGARQRAAVFLNGKPRGPSAYVRINPLTSGRTEADLDAIVAARPDGIVLAGAEGGDDVLQLSALIRPREAAAGLPDRSIRIIASVTDTPAAIFRLGSYAGSSSRLAGLLWDRTRLAMGLGAELDRSDEATSTDVYQSARMLVLAGAAAAGVVAIDGPFPDASDAAGLEKEALAARRAGFAAKVAIHRDQVPVINRVFQAPSSR